MTSKFNVGAETANRLGDGCPLDFRPIHIWHRGPGTRRLVDGRDLIGFLESLAVQVKSEPKRDVYHGLAEYVALMTEQEHGSEQRN